MWLRLFGMMGVAVGASSCVASQDVKVASQKINQTLESVQGVEAQFNAQLLREIERTRDQVAQAIVASAVYAKVESIANDLEKQGDLIGLATQIEQTQSQTENLVTWLLEASENTDTTDPTKLRDDLITKAKSAESRPGLDPHTVQQIRARVQILENVDHLLPASAKGDLSALLRLNRMAVSAKGNTLIQLDRHLRNIQALHKEVDRWIQTDVTVQGDEVAKLVGRVTAQVNGPAGPGARP